MTHDAFDFRAARDAFFSHALPHPLKLVGLALVEFMPVCRPSVQTLADRCGVERKTILRALGRLERLGVITIERATGLRSRYHLQPVPSWRTGPSESPVPPVSTGTPEPPVPQKDGTGTNHGTGPVPQRDGTGTSEGPKAVLEADQESRRADPERARPRVTGALEAVARTVTMPGPDPTPSYLAACTMAGVKPAQAQSTWCHYFGAGLPQGGVERLEAWLVQRACEKQTQRLTAPARASPARPGDDLDTTGAACAFKPNADHEAFSRAWLSRESLTLYAQKCRAVPRFASLSTAEQDREFLARLRHLKQTGMFFADGPLPKLRAQKEASP
mgnify:CR=1 FL=1